MRMFFPSRNRKRTGFFLVGLVTLVSTQIYAQDLPLVQVTPMTPLERGAASLERFFFPINPNQPLEGPIDPASYIVGPNDILSFSIGGINPQIEHIPITSDGYLILVGKESIQAAGRPLADVIAEARASLKTIFPNDPIDLRLAQPRSFYVHVSGGVPNPGRHVANPLARLDEVIREAINEVNPDQKQISWQYRPTIRDIRIERENGTIMTVDLYRYFMLGDKSHNPLLLDNDQIFVPTHHIVDDIINVQGTLPFPGPYPFRSDDTLLGILQLAVGSTDLTDLDNVSITRTATDGTVQSDEYNVASLVSGNAPLPEIRPGDRIFVPDYTYNSGYVFVEGEVNYPGPFLVKGGRTTLRELVQASGGMRDEALLRAAYIERAREASDVTSPYYLPSTGGDEALVQRGRLGSLDLSSRLYLERELMLNKRISLNLAVALAPGSPDTYLYPGDRLIVPRDQQKVQVIGEVVRPGFVDFKKGAGPDEYIAETGGRGDRATDIFVINASTGQLVDAYRTEIQSGDVIFVDRADLADTQELQVLELQRQNLRAQRTSLILSAVTTASVVVSIVLRLFDL